MPSRSAYHAGGVPAEATASGAWVPTASGAWINPSAAFRLPHLEPRSGGAPSPGVSADRHRTQTDSEASQEPDPESWSDAAEDADRGGDDGPDGDSGSAAVTTAASLGVNELPTAEATTL